MVRAMGPLTVCVLSIAISNIWNLKAAPASIRVVGSIPKVRVWPVQQQALHHPVLACTCTTPATLSTRQAGTCRQARPW